jgi:MraZ protein
LDYFEGRFEYAMDDRGRVPVPPRFRDAFLTGGVINQGPDPCLRVFTSDSFQEQAQLHTRDPAIDRAARMTRRGFFANSFRVELDRQGRILVPAPLRDYAGLRGNVVVSGAGEWLEVWDPGRFEAEMRTADEHLQQAGGQGA